LRAQQDRLEAVINSFDELVAKSRPIIVISTCGGKHFLPDRLIDE